LVDFSESYIVLIDENIVLPKTDEERTYTTHRMDLQINIRKNVTYLNSTIMAEALFYITLRQGVFLL